MTAKWMLYGKKADFESLSARYGISPITARIIRNRDVVGEEAMERYLHGTIKDLHSPYLLKDGEKAAGILVDAIKEGKRIRIVGDYDIDGVCSACLLYHALKRVNASVDYEIPDRVKDGYGINQSIIEAAADDGIHTIITCDNGIAAIEQIKRARELGIKVIITDHHEITKEGGVEILPPADAIVNPKQSSCHYPFKEICGAVVAFKLIRILYDACGVPADEWEDLLEFAAIATVGDVMKLQDENRILVKEGLKRIADTRCLGLRKLIEQNNLDIGHLSAYHIGFVIGPCLNAGGRLQTAKLALSLLLCEEEGQADDLAAELKALNDRRKDMTKDSLEEAVAQVEQHHALDQVLVVFLEQCHESLAGIIAGRLRERYHKPAIVLTYGEHGVKGSGRSIEAYSMFEALTEVKQFLTKFGGHPMAAGMSLNLEDVESFRQALNRNCRLTPDAFIPKIWIDVPLPVEYISEAFIGELGVLEPFGQGNEKPQFAQKHLHIRTARVLGKNRNAVKLCLISDQGTVIDGILFGDGDAFIEEMGSHRRINIIYYPGVNEYNGNKSLQLTIKEYEFTEG